MPRKQTLPLAPSRSTARKNHPQRIARGFFFFRKSLGVYQDKEIVAFHEAKTRHIICRECSTPQQWNDITEDDIITQETVDKKGVIYFCDECKKKLKVSAAAPSQQTGTGFLSKWLLKS